MRHPVKLIVLMMIAFLRSTAAGQAPATQTSPQFTIGLSSSGVTSLKHTHDVLDTDYIQFPRSLGPLVISYRQAADAWKTVRTTSLKETVGTDLDLTESFKLDGDAMVWSISLRNVTDKPLEIGDLGFPLCFNTRFTRNKTVTDTQRQLLHFWLAGHGSFIFLMRPNSVGPYLVITPTGNTKLEYFDREAQPGGAAGGGGFGSNVMYIHSAAIAAQARQRGGNWRIPNTSATVAPNDEVTYGFKLRWGDGYEGVRNVLYEENQFDVNVAPGMTIPIDLPAMISLRTRNKIDAIEPEFSDQTKIEALGAGGGKDTSIYKVNFARLGENRLMVRYNGGKYTSLEFFVTEPLETLIRKRASFLVSHQQHRDPTKWYNGLFSEWDQTRHILRSPDDTDGLRDYVVACDDPGLCKAPYVASKNVSYPDQREVEAIDYYIHNYVWGGLQCTEKEPYPYAIYGIPNWKVNRDSTDPGRNGRNHLWRIYDYPHVILLYFRMYQIARLYPEIKTELTADEYLQRAFGTAKAFFTVPMAIERWSAYGTGTYNEVIIPDLIDALVENGKTDQAKEIRGHWERKVAHFVNDDPYLFGSEYAFDSTGFESTHALAKWAMERMTAPGMQSPVTREAASQFMEKQIRYNIADRGWLETAYYHLGSDYRAGFGFGYTLSYMSQMGGWGVLDYALHYAGDPAPYLRVGYASYLSSWALMNTGTPESNYGYWYPGKENDGAAGGGFEARSWATSWLRKSHPRGAWYYSCEIDLGYNAAIRSAATVVADDPLFGPIAYGGSIEAKPDAIEVIPKDGLRQRLHVMRDKQRLHLMLNRDGFAADQPIRIAKDGSEIRFILENRSAGHAHPTTLNIAGTNGRITVEGLAAKITPASDSSAIEFQVGPEAQYPIRIQLVQ
ncbi:MAG TPA: DUF5695 domain-containing protein [Tepidisphaeraceae bacterium]